MPRVRDLPTLGNPNTSKVKRDRKRKIIQRRYYGADGKAIINIDYDHDHGAGKPHAHDWDWTQDLPVRLPARRLTVAEKKRKKRQ
jgi:hypothetical protein